jgi:tRNA modification GTPase
MLPDPQETIVALSSAPGPGKRAIVRISGPSTFRLLDSVFSSLEKIDSSRRGLYNGSLRLPEVHSQLPAQVYVWPGPKSFTGQDLVELHTLSSNPLVELLIAQILDAGARASQPGEFTLRAFLAGKLDLTQVEAILGIIEAGNRDELKQALVQLAGGLARPLQDLRDGLLNLLADVEAGLDFTEDDIQFVGQTDLLNRLATAMAHVTLLQKQLSERSRGHRPFRVVIAGKPNAGKSSLFNALVGTGAALVSPVPGTTRDYLVKKLKVEEVALELVDTAGWQESNGIIEDQAQVLCQLQAEQADLLLLCLEAGKPIDERDTGFLAKKGLPAVIGVATKCDAASPAPHLLATSAVTKFGLDSLRKLLAEKAREFFRPGLAPSLSRCRHHVNALLDHLRQAHAAVLYQEPPEILALELRCALAQMGEIMGTAYTDDLLDRIFSRFCIGK